MTYVLSHNPTTLPGSINTPGTAVYGGPSKAWDVTNFYTVYGTGTNGVGILLRDGGSIVNGSNTDTTAVIGGNEAVRIEGQSGTIVNYGTIGAGLGGSAGINLLAGGTVVNSGLIQAVPGIKFGGVGTVLNYGTISGYGSIQLSAGGNIVNGSNQDTSATIGSSAGISLGIISLAAVTITNYGTITNTTNFLTNGVSLVNGGGTVINGSNVDAVALIHASIGVNASTSASIINFGTIDGQFYGVLCGAGGEIINGSFANTIATITAQDGIGVKVSGGAGTIINYGTIATAGILGISPLIHNNGVKLLSGGTVVNGPSALITSDAEAVYIFSDNGTITNYGTIIGGHSGSGYSGIRFVGFGGTVTNFGTISGDYTAISFTAGYDQLVLGPTSVFVGSVDGGAGVDTVDIAQPGRIDFCNISGFETFQLASSGVSTLILTDANFADVTNLTITVVGGDGGDTLDASAVTAPDFVRTNSVDFTGGAGADLALGGGGGDVLDGGPGVDALFGGLGNDTYIVDTVGDAVYESLNAGVDAVWSSISYTLGDNLENLALIGSANIDGTGNDLGNTIIGNSGNNTLDGGTGFDALFGGAGNDTYIVDAFIVNLFGDAVIEGSGQGIDAVWSSVSYTLGANVENLALTGTADTNGTGNALSNTLIGNSDNNTLDGGAGVDVMYGSPGNDTYIVDTLGDAVIEKPGDGVDAVWSFISDALGDNLENLALIGTADIYGVGNALDNTILGNIGNNSLDGGAGRDILNGRPGNDTLTGGSGADTFVFDSALNSMTNVDHIVDFSTIEDSINLAQTVFTTLGPAGALPSNEFRIGTGAQDADDRIIYNNTTGSLSYDLDGTGAASATQFATLSTGLGLTSANFRIV